MVTGTPDFIGINRSFLILQVQLELLGQSHRIPQSVPIELNILATVKGYWVIYNHFMEHLVVLK